MSCFSQAGAGRDTLAGSGVGESVGVGDLNAVGAAADVLLGDGLGAGWSTETTCGTGKAVGTGRTGFTRVRK